MVHLELVGLIALLIFDNSIACRNYLKARFTHIIIDEYQDSGYEQHKLFIKIKNLGICAVAVGDADQSIFGFAKRDSRFLLELARKKEIGFNVYSLNKNHRCHTSIVNYATGFLNSSANLSPVEEIKIYEKKIIGSQVDISKWIDEYLPRIMLKLGVEKNNQVAILVRGNVSGEILDGNLKLNHKYFKGTPLDNDSNLWSQLFRELLIALNDKENNKYEIVEKYIDVHVDRRNAKEALLLLQQLSSELAVDPYNICAFEEEIIELARILLPRGENDKSKNLLNEIINNPLYIDAYHPAKPDEVQIMTIHKSKGLEFDVVFHLDLYKYILPNTKSNNLIQDINLHYVGLTRAKKALFLLWSTERFNAAGEIKPGIQSDFLAKDYLRKLRRLIHS